MIGVLVAVGSWFGALLKGNLGSGPGSSSSAWPGWPSPRSRSTCSSRPRPGRRASAAHSLAAYRGLGTWVDIFDATSWAHPETMVAKMKARGVRTLFLETGNYSQTVDVVRPSGQARFIDAAHARGMKVVAWYLPSFSALKKELRRSLAAINFRTPSGGQFDSFALDIEASVVKSVAAPEQAAAHAVVADPGRSRRRVHARRDHPVTARHAARQGVLGAASPTPISASPTTSSCRWATSATGRPTSAAPTATPSATSR